MNRRQYFYFIIALLSFGPAWQSALFGQVETLPPVIPPSVTGAADPMSQKSLIVSTIAPAVAIIVTPSSPDQLKGARSWLVARSEDANTQADPTAYKAAYSAALSDTLLSQLPSANAPARLNLALVVDSVADRTHSHQLAPAITALLGDQSDAVVLVGVEAAGDIIPDALSNDAASTNTAALMKALVSAVANHSTPPLGGWIAKQAIDDLDPIVDQTGQLGSLAGNALSLLADTMMDLEQTRIDLYKDAIPESPRADDGSSLLLLENKYYSQLTPKEQTRAIQEASDLIGCIGGRIGSGGINENIDMVNALKREASQLGTLAQAAGFSNSSLTQAVSGIQVLNGTSPATAVQSACQAIFPALQSSGPQFASLNPPPTLNAMNTPSPGGATGGAAPAAGGGAAPAAGGGTDGAAAAGGN